MSEKLERLVTLLDEKLGDRVDRCEIVNGQVIVQLPAASLRSVCQTLHDDPALAFEQCVDVCGVDYSEYGDADWQTQSASNQGFSRGVSVDSGSVANSFEGVRYLVAYQLISYSNNQRVRLKVPVPGEAPKLDSVADIWSSANWPEREAFDMFGILFDGHPDLRRILTDYGFIGHPFRKDFPLNGNVEVRYDPEKKRVVYQPVTIENRVLVPRVIREDERFAPAEQNEESGNA